jgi:hypothetical protein
MQMTAIFAILTSALLAANESRIPAPRCRASEQLKLVDYDSFGKLDLQGRLMAYQTVQQVGPGRRTGSGMMR